MDGGASSMMFLFSSITLYCLPAWVALVCASLEVEGRWWMVWYDCQPSNWFRIWFFVLGWTSLPVYDFCVRGRPSRRGCLFWWVGSRLLPLSHLFAGWNRRISGPFHFSSKTFSTKASFTLSSKVLPSFCGAMASPAARSTSPVICRASGLVKSKNPRPTPIRIFSITPSPPHHKWCVGWRREQDLCGR